MVSQRRYWVISPNADGKGTKVEEWKKEIINHNAAILGWNPNQSGSGGMGPRFAGDPGVRNKLQKGDVLLIARGKKAVDIVGFGIVSGNIKQYKPVWSELSVYRRKLNPFKLCTEAPKSIPLLKILQHTKAFVQKYPSQNPNDNKVFEWIIQQLGLEHTESDDTITSERRMRKSKKYDYEWKQKNKVRQARQHEKELTDAYKQYLSRKGHEHSCLYWGKTECDIWEHERRNLIEAEASVRYEDIRMAVGQLFHYAFLGRDKCEQMNKAILLPEEPKLASLQWLEPLGIKLIWRRGRSFIDNANGQFT